MLTHAASNIYTSQGIGGGGAMSSFSMSPYDENLWFVGTDMGMLFRSLDKGQTWYPIDQNQITYDSNLFYQGTIGFCADPNIVFFADTGKNPIRSIDKGETWRPIDINLEPLERIKYWVSHSENENIVICATDEKLFRSIDKGVTWIPCNISGPSVGSFFDYQEGQLYHATTNGIFISNDLGETFTTYLNTTVRGFAGGRDSNGLTLVYIDGDGENAVRPWIQPFLGKVDGAEQIDITRSAATSGFVWVKPAGATQFNKIAHSQNYKYEGQVIHTSTYLDASGEIYLKEDNAIYPIDRDQYNRGGVHMAENDSQTIYVTGGFYWPRMYGTKTFVTTNAGQTWGKKFQIIDWDENYSPWPADKLEYSAVGVDIGWDDGSFDNFAVNQTDSSYAGGTGYYFLHVSSDKGETWKAPFTEFADTEPRIERKFWKSRGLEVTSVNKIEFHPDNSQLMYVGMGDIGGYMSENAGQTVRLCDANINSIYDFAFDPDDDNIVYSANSTEHDWPIDWHRGVSGAVGGIYKSGNRGMSWERLTPQDGGFNRGYLSVAYDKSRNILYGGTHGYGIIRSLDSGATWEFINNGIPANQGRIISQIELDANGNVYALLSGDFASDASGSQADTGIYFLDVQNGATTWQLLRGNLNSPNGTPISSFWKYPTGFAVDPNNSNVLWLIDHEIEWECGGVWKSIDGGQNWNRVIQYTHPMSVMLDPDDPNKVYVSGSYEMDGSWGNGGLMYTLDGGATWHKNTRVPFKNPGFCSTIDPNNTNKIWYGFHGAGMMHGPRPGMPSFINPVSPNEPQNIQSNIDAYGKVHLSWDVSSSDSEIIGYYVYRSFSDTVYHSSLIGFVNGNSFIDDRGFAADTWVTYRIKAEDLEGDMSEFSETYVYIENSYNNANIIVPSNLQASLISPTQVNLVWQDNSDNETGFKIERMIGSGIDYEEIATVSANSTSYQDNGLLLGNKYFYRIRAFNTAGYSDYATVTFVVTSNNYDVNNDGQVDDLDIKICIRNYLNNTYLSNADFNDDGILSEIDIFSIILNVKT
ncbi:hypothetical protein BVX93_01675 [bacterium B13(2017)]|nr:hypothetical protein BVX93_01675 [bacterium B13(2017)]